MYSNVTNSTSFDLFNLKRVKISHGSAFYAVTLSSSVINAILSLVAVLGNALVLAAIWRNQNLRTPSYILLAGLAFTDFSTGLITQPFYVAQEVILLTEPSLKTVGNTSSYTIIRFFAYGCATFFSNMTLVIATFMSIERWLHRTRSSLITVRRACLLFLSSLFIPIPLVVFRVLNNTRGTQQLETDILSISILLLCLSVTSVAYLKVFRIIRRHQQQVQPNVSSQNFAQPAINFEKHKKSVYTIIYILNVFYIGYIPVLISFGLQLVLKSQKFSDILLTASKMCVFLSSSLNPLLYLWRMNDTCNEVRQLVKRLLRLET